MLFRRAKPPHNDNEPVPAMAAESPSVIGRNAEFAGNLTVEGDIRIEGLVRGTVRAGRCIIDSDGVVEGEVLADDIIVRGRVRGPLKGYFVHLESGAEVMGDIVNERIVIDSGAELTGSVWRSSDPFGEDSRSEQQPAAAAHESSSLFRTSMWPDTDSHGYRPLTAVRPR
jgi:cytoskeletal protein CcmA (bactofilin family)